MRKIGGLVRIIWEFGVRFGVAFMEFLWIFESPVMGRWSGTERPKWGGAEERILFTENHDWKSTASSCLHSVITLCPSSDSRSSLIFASGGIPRLSWPPYQQVMFGPNRYQYPRNPSSSYKLPGSL